MKILFSGCPGYGHLYPMLPLARAAVRAGHDVVLATGPDLAPHLAGRGFQTWAVGPSLAESWARRNDAGSELGPIPPERHLELDFAVLFGDSAAKRAADLAPRAERWRPDIVIHEPAEFAGPIVAHRAGAWCATHGLGLNPPADFRTVAEPAMVDVFTPWGVPDLASEVFAGPLLDIGPAGLSPGGDRAFTRSVPLRPDPGDVVPTDRLPASLDALPAGDTVYLTLGTVFHEVPDVFHACLAGLRELPVNVVVTVGPDVDPARLGPQPPTVVIEPYIPQALLLPRCRLVISHAGSGTMLGAFANGLPQLMLPQAADQFFNAAAAEAAGAAVTLPPGTVTPDAIHTAARRLLDEPGFALAAKTLQAEIESLPSAEDVLTGIVAEVRAWVG